MTFAVPFHVPRKKKLIVCGDPMTFPLTPVIRANLSQSNDWLDIHTWGECKAGRTVIQ